MKNNVIVLDTLQAAGADAVMSNSYLVLTGASALPPIEYRNIIPNSYSKVSYTAGSAGTWQATFPAGAAGDSVSVILTCIPSVGQPIVVVVNYTASGTLTAANNGTAFGAAATAAAVAKAAALGVSVPFTVSGTTTPILTASSAYLQISGVIKRQPSSSYLTSVSNTLGTASQGTAAAVTAAGGVLNTGGVAFTGTTYDKYTFVYQNPTPSSSLPNDSGAPATQITYFVNSTAGTNYTNLTNRLTYIFSSDNTYASLPAETLAVA